MERISYETRLDPIFAALADPTRRAILRRLAEGEASVKELAAPFAMSQPAVSKHLSVLERAGLVTRRVERQRRPVRLNAQPLREASLFLHGFNAFWEESLDALAQLMTDLQTQSDKEKSHD